MAMLLTCTGPAWADTFGVGGSFNGSFAARDYCSGSSGNDSTGWADSGTHSFSFNGHSPCYVTSEHGQGTGQASFGSLQGTANTTAALGTGDGSDIAFWTELYWNDEITVTTAGQLTFAVTLADTLNIIPGGPGLGGCGVNIQGYPGLGTAIVSTCALADASLIGAGNVAFIQDSTKPGGSSQNPTVTFNVYAGEVIPVSGYLTVGAGACASGIWPDCLIPSPGSTTARSDANGSANFFIDGASYTTASGSNYSSPSPATVPEPSSLVLLGSGLAGLVGVIRRKINA